MARSRDQGGPAATRDRSKYGQDARTEKTRGMCVTCSDAAGYLHFETPPITAASLTPSLLTGEQMRSMLQKVTETLLTPLGLRSLSPDDPSYCKHFDGNQQQRDGAYHRGTVWQWLIGPYVDVHLSVYNDRAALRSLLQPLVQHLWDACLGTISEVAEPEPPFTPAGCYAQAWSVAEVLRCWRSVQV